MLVRADTQSNRATIALGARTRLTPDHAGPFHKVNGTKTTLTDHSTTVTEIQTMILRHGCLSNVILDKHPAKVYLVKCTPNSFQQQMISLHALHYNPVERVNRILKTMISQYMGQNH